MQKIFEAAKAPIVWDEQHIGKEVDPRTNSMVTRENLDSVLVSGSQPFRLAWAWATRVCVLQGCVLSCVAATSQVVWCEPRGTYTV